MTEDAVKVDGPSAEPRPAPLSVVVATMMGPSGATGVQTHVTEVCEYLASRGARPQVVTPFSWGGPLSIPVFGARRAIDPFSGAASIAWYRYWHYVFLKRALDRDLATRTTDIVYAQCTLAARAAIEARRDRKTKVVIAIHSDGSQADEWADKKMLRVGSRVYRSIIDTEQRFMPQVDGIVYVSEAARAGMQKHVKGLDGIPFAVVPNFVSIPAVSRDRSLRAAKKRDMITVGGLEIAKNHRYLLQILSAAGRNGHRYTLDLAGDGPCRQPLESLSKSLGLDDQVRFLGSRKDVRDLLPGYRVYTHTSIRESLCMAIIEAMASGLPVVAGAIGGIPELFDPGREGLVWPLDDPESAARILIGLLEDESELQMLGAAARARFESSFDSSVVGPTLEGLFVSTHPGDPR
jgi:glycosyltransferase involved in cell wall biosynthesis